jgi:hypothetical protein
MWHYPIPLGNGRWAAAYSVPGSDRWTPAVECPTEAAARAECERLNAGEEMTAADIATRFDAAGQ